MLLLVKTFMAQNGLSCAGQRTKMTL